MLNLNKSYFKRKKLFHAIIFCMILCLSGFIKSPMVEASSTVAYKMQNKTVTYKEGNKVRGIVSFEYPKFEGNTIQISKINKVLEKAMKAYMADENAKSIKEYTLDSIKNKRFTDNNEQYYWTTSCEITYNANHIISMSMSEMWYAGGVHNQSDYGYTFDLKTGKVLTAVDVIGGTSKQVKSIVLSKLKKYFKKNYKDSFNDLWKDVSNVINSYDSKKFKYFLTPGKVYVCFESYELNCGAVSQIISVASKYK